jgi:phage tail-like protein
VITVDQRLFSMLTNAFRFIVAIDGAPLGAFTECTLPTIEWDVEEVKEGGINTHVHQFPGQRRRTTITLKNGVGIASDLLAWYITAINERFWRRRVTITLLNSLLVPVIVLHIEDAFPIKWTGPQLKTDDNAVAVQTLELACGEITLV